MSRYEPLTTHEVTASPLSKQYLQRVRCLPFCEKVKRVKYHARLTKLFATQLKKDKVMIAGVKFTISTDVIVEAIGIPSHGDKWFKNQDLEIQNYKPYLRRHYQQHMKKIFLVGNLLEKYTPLMKIIMK